MTIQSDLWIIRQCIKPSFVLEMSATASHFVVDVPDRGLVWQDDGGKLFSQKKDLRPYQKEHGADTWKPMIEPFEPKQVKTRTRAIHCKQSTWEEDRKKVIGQGRLDPEPDGDTIEEKIISYGVSSYGYDLRLSNKFKIFSNIASALIDPLNMSDTCYVDREGDFCIIPPNSYILGHTIETVHMPRDVTAICMSKSTYARAGAIINPTVIEAGFIGQIVIEISNATPLPMKVYANQGIAQLLFLKSDEQCEVSYADRGGKYMHQQGVQTAIV